MPLLTALLVLATSSSGAVKLASSGFAGVNLDAKTADFFDEYFAQQLQGAGVPVTTKSAVAALVGLERQRQLMGCSEESSTCLAELAGALGVDGLVVGNLGKFGGEYVVTVKLVSAKNAATVFSESARLDGDRALLDWLTRTGRKMAEVAKRGIDGRPAVATPQPPQTKEPVALPMPPPPAGPVQGRDEARLTRSGTGAPVGAWIATGLAAALAAGSGVTYGIARGEHAALTEGNRVYDSYPQVQAAAQTGGVLQTTSALLLGGAIASAGVATWLFLAPRPQALVVAPTPGGAVVLIQGALP